MATVSLRQSRLIMIPPSREIATQNRLTRMLHRLWDIPTRTVVALKHHYYDELFTAQEVLEIVLLSQRGYAFTQWQSQSWPLRCYVVFLVASCWCTPFFHWKLHSTKATQRLVSKVADMLCDFATTLVLPAAMSWPQLPRFDAHFVWYHGDTSESGAGTDLQQKALQGMPQTTFDVLNAVVFSVFLMTRVVGVRASIRLQSTTEHSQKQAMWVVVNKPRRQGQRLWMRAIHTLAFVWGLVVVIATIISETRSRKPGIPVVRHESSVHGGSIQLLNSEYRGSGKRARPAPVKCEPYSSARNLVQRQNAVKRLKNADNF